MVRGWGVRRRAQGVELAVGREARVAESVVLAVLAVGHVAIVLKP